MNSSRNRRLGKKTARSCATDSDAALTKAACAKLTKAQLIDEIIRLKSTSKMLIDEIHAPIVHELAVRQFELEMQNHELQKAQAQLEEARDRYADFHISALTGYLTLDKNGCILEINPAAAAMLGRGRALLIGSPFCAYLSPGFSDSFHRHLHQAFGASGKSVVELNVNDADGQPRHILLASAIKDEEAGKPRACRTTMTDITEQKRAEQALNESEERLKLMAETITEVFWMIDIRTGKLVTVSPSYEQVWKRSCKELYENPYAYQEAIHPEDVDRVRASVQAIESSHSPFDQEYRIIWPDGTIRWILNRGFPVHAQTGERKVIRYAGVAQDITRLREAEHRMREVLLQNRLLTRDLFSKKEEERRHLARELHDEIGQWLTAIQAEAGAILSCTEVNPPASILAGARAISDSATEMHQLIRGIINRMRPSLLDALGLADSLRELVAQWRERHPNIHCDLALEGGIAGLSDEINITVYRVLQEALTNIAKHAQASRVTVRLCRTSGPGSAADVLALTIKDDGRGMLQNASSGGLGLLGMRERVLALGGEFTQTSIPGDGVRLDVRLPLGGVGYIGGRRAGDIRQWDQPSTKRNPG